MSHIKTAPFHFELFLLMIVNVLFLEIIEELLN
jgi:hypothetical protein